MNPPLVLFRAAKITPVFLIPKKIEQKMIFFLKIPVSTHFLRIFVTG